MELAKTSAPATYEYATFKSELEEALVARFGRAAVTLGCKAFDIKSNAYRVESDVAASFEHRRYVTTTSYHSGVEMIPDDYDPPGVRNWPEQHYENGVSKNTSRSRRFKRVVRLLKNLTSEMASSGIQSAKNAPSFLIESLVFNASNSCFEYQSFKPMVRHVIEELFNNMSDEKCFEWGEVKELKYLFRSSQPWTHVSAHQFLSDARDYIGYE